MLEIIHGKAGTGKSALLYKKINEAAESGKKVFLFVPDQFSFEAEKIIYKTVKPPYGMNVSVTMFSRAAQQILKLYGETKAYADDIVKNVLIKRAVTELKAENSLVFYEKQSKNSGFSKMLLEIISELKNGGITPSALRSRIADYGSEFSDSLTAKLNDIAEIYSRYDLTLTSAFNDKLDDVRRAAELALGSDYFENSVCFFDCFDDFSGSQLSFIKSILIKAERAVFALTSDLSEDSPHFYGTTRLIYRLKEMSDGDCRLIPMETVYRRPSECEIIKARDMWQECDWICAQIHRLIDEGYLFRDIAVLIPDKAYTHILESALKKYDISAFEDVPEPLIDKAAVRFAVYSLQALSFETDDILRYIKSGFVRRSDGKTISNIQIDRLEQLCRRYDIRKRDWLRSFPEGIDKTGEAEALRRDITEPLRTLKKALENADGAEMTEALCGFLCRDMDIGAGIYSRFLDGRDENGKVIVNKKKQDEYSAVWEAAVEIFESAYEALRGSRFNLNEYTEILTDIFTSAHIAKPPQVIDAVTVGDVERSRFGNVRAVFLCGFNQGIFPRSAALSGGFTGGEAEKLSACGITIGGDRISRSSAELFKLYRCENLPSEKLFVTYPLLNDKFSELAPSPYIKEIENRFSVTVNGADSFGADFYCRTEKSARRYLAENYSVYSKRSERKAVLDALSEKGYERFLEQSFRGGGDRHIISEENAERLLKKEDYSPTSLEKLNNCKYSFFCSEGLRISEPPAREIGARISGNTVHYCLERLLTDYMNNGEGLKALSDEDIESLVKDYISDYLSDELLDGFGASGRFSYQITRLAELAVPAAINIRDNIKNGSFLPACLEQKLKFRFGDITVKGRCDRYDISSIDGTDYIRVVDYKRGKNRLPVQDIFKGENLQTLLYLFGLCEAHNAKPSSVMYQPIGAYDRKNAASSDLEKEEKQNIRDNAAAHNPNGIIINGTPEFFDKDSLESFYEEKYGGRRNGYCKSEIISEQDFYGMKEYCKAYVNAIAMEAAKGMASACPKDESKCRWCDFSLFCGHKPVEEDEDE